MHSHSTAEIHHYPTEKDCQPLSVDSDNRWRTGLSRVPHSHTVSPTWPGSCRGPASQTLPAWAAPRGLLSSGSRDNKTDLVMEWYSHINKVKFTEASAKQTVLLLYSAYLWKEYSFFFSFFYSFWPYIISIIWAILKVRDRGLGHGSRVNATISFRPGQDELTVM